MNRKDTFVKNPYPVPANNLRLTEGQSKSIAGKVGTSRRNNLSPDHLNHTSEVKHVLKKGATD